MGQRVLKDLPDGAALERLRIRHGRSQVIDRDPRLPWLIRHGAHAMAYSSLQPAMHHFVLDQAGYLAFRPGGAHHVVLGDPIGPLQAYPALFAAFSAYSADAGRGVLAVQTSAAAADAVRPLGYARHYFGLETSIALPDHDLQGKPKSYLRRACNRARASGVTVRELGAGEPRDPESSDLAPDRARTRTVSERWLTSRGSLTIELLIRPFVPCAELDVRTFCGFVGDEMIGFVTFDPLYRDGSIIGYYQQHMRYTESAPNGTVSLITEAALARFRHEGREILDLGLSPFAGIDAHRGPDAPDSSDSMFTRITRRLYRRSAGPDATGHDDHYRFRGNYFQKSRYRGHETPVFLLEYPPTRTDSLKVLARATGLYPGA